MAMTKKASAKSNTKSTCAFIKWISDPPSWDVIKLKDIVLPSTIRLPEIDEVYDVEYDSGPGEKERAPARILFLGTYLLNCGS